MIMRLNGLHCLMLPMVLILTGIPASARPVSADAVVGTWLVEQPAAPFPLHLYVFNADHTMQQANPDAGNPRTSDSDGKGAWQRRGNRVTGKWVEIMADRITHKLAGRGEFSYEIEVSGDRLTGSGTFFCLRRSGQCHCGSDCRPVHRFASDCAVKLPSSAS